VQAPAGITAGTAAGITAGTAAGITAGTATGIMGRLRVRPPWSLLRRWRQVRERRATPANEARPEPRRYRPIGAAPPPLTAQRHRLRSLAATGRPLAGAPDAGPELRPGHDLILRPLSPPPGTVTSETLGGSGRPMHPPGVRFPHDLPGRPADHPGHAAAAHPRAGQPLIMPPSLHRSARAGGDAGTGHALTAHGLAARGPEAHGPEVHGLAAGGLSAHGLAARGLGAHGLAAHGPEAEFRDGEPASKSASRTGLATRPGDGPTVHNPRPATDLPVLGSAALPPGSEPDPMGAVQFSPAVAHRPGRGGDLARRGVDSAVRVPEKSRSSRHDVGGHAAGGGSSPRERWEAAVAARPLETPRSLPMAFHAMASAITGRARAPLFTTGPATRHALAAAGALGATTGTVVHLPAVPSPAPAAAAVLAHELTHTRSPVRRPRFLLGGLSGLLDDDERSALSAGREALSAGRGALSAGRDALSAGRDQLASAGREQLTDAVGSAAPIAAGIVDQLPVGGGIGAVGDVATRAARAAVLEAAASPIGSATGWANDARGAATGVLDTAGGLASGAWDTAGGLASGAMGAAGGPASGAMSAASGAMSAASGAADAATGAASGLVSSATGAVGGAAAAATAALDPDKVVEIVEARLLREIERRGGRWAGVF
jgi:hypothetical protein